MPYNQLSQGYVKRKKHIETLKIDPTIFLIKSNADLLSSKYQTPTNHMDSSQQIQLYHQVTKSFNYLDHITSKISSPQIPYPLSPLQSQERKREMTEKFQTVSIENDLKHTLTSISQVGESGFCRNHSIKLTNWFNKNIIRPIDLKVIQSRQILNQINQVLSVSFQELSSFLKKKCYEQGHLIETMWEYCLEFMKAIQDHYELEQQNNQVKSIEEFNRIHQLYKDKAQKGAQEYIEKDRQISKLNEKIEVFQSDYKDIEIQYLKTREQLQEIKKVAILLKKKTQHQQDEINKLNRQIEKLQIQGAQQFVEQKISKDKRTSLIIVQSSKIINIGNQLKQQQNNPNNVSISQSSEEDDEERFYEELLHDKNAHADINNMVINMQKIVKVKEQYSQVTADLFPFYTKEIQIQTNLRLMDHQFDQILEDQDKIISYYKYLEEKQKVDDNLSFINKRIQKNLKENMINQAIESKFFYRNNQQEGEFKIPEKDTEINKLKVDQIRIILYLMRLQCSQIIELEMQLEEVNRQRKLLLENEKEQNQKLQQLEQQLQSDEQKMKKMVQVEQSFQVAEEIVIQADIVQADKKQNKKQSKLQNQLIMFQSPHLGQKVQLRYEFQKHNAGSNIIQKVKQKQVAKIKNHMTQKLLVKQINLIYADRIQQQKDNNDIKDQEMATFVYSYFLAQYGISKIAEQKFLILVLSVKHHKAVLRVNVFAKFLGLFDPVLNYSVDELKKYLDALDFIMNVSTLGTLISEEEFDGKFYVPFIRAQHYMGQLPDQRMSPQEKEDFKKEVERLKEQDPKNINRQGIIDFDAFMIQLFIKYKVIVSKAKEHVINAFAACDLDGNGMCNYEEWYLLLRHIEPERFTHDQVSEIFFSNADLFEEGEQNFSFDKFAVVCVEYGLFSDESQNHFINSDGSDQDILEKFKVICQVWPVNKLEIIQRLDKVSIIPQEKINSWKQIIDTLENKLNEAEEVKHDSSLGIRKLKPLLIAYLLLQKETQLLIQLQYDQNISEEQDRME